MEFCYEKFKEQLVLINILTIEPNTLFVSRFRFYVTRKNYEDSEEKMMNFFL